MNPNKISINEIENKKLGLGNRTKPKKNFLN